MRPVGRPKASSRAWKRSMIWDGGMPSCRRSFRRGGPIQSNRICCWKLCQSLHPYLNEVPGQDSAVGICRWSVGTGPDEPELRRLKSIAASRGVSVQQAMQGAIENVDVTASRKPRGAAGGFPCRRGCSCLDAARTGSRVGPGPALEPECPDRFLIPRPDGLVKPAARRGPGLLRRLSGGIWAYGESRWLLRNRRSRWNGFRSD